MQTRQLGNSDLFLTPLGTGAWAMGGGGWAFSWGAQDDAESVAAIRAAVDAGMNWIDTAAVYGLGHSEEVVAKAVEGLADRPYIFTKCERCWDESGGIIKRLKRDSVRSECEDSLRRLKVDVIDLYQIHWPEPDEDIEEGWEAMLRLKEEGKVRWTGVSNFSVAQLERIRRLGPITSLQPPYNLLAREIEGDTLPYCAAHNIGVLCYSPMHSGLLTGKMTRERIATMDPDDHRQRRPQFQEPLLSRNLALVELLREIGGRHGRTAGETALAWTLRRPEVTASITGLRSAAQLEGVIGAAEFRLSAEEVDQIEGFLNQA
ncbi:MAG: aldo/keto reductase [Candidatus Solibacter usitatus]|nr:aldo/keto reductase [Candidatus Solibacter usitatus]